MNFDRLPHYLPLPIPIGIFRLAYSDWRIPIVRV